MRGLALAVVIVAACGESSSEGGETGDGDDAGAATGNECVACPFEPPLDAAESASEQAPMDCGTIDDNLDVEAWTSARDCLLAALQAQTAVVLVWRPSTIDNIHLIAIVGATAETYAITMIDWDCYNGDVMADTRSCDSVVPAPNCTVAPGTICLDC